MNFLDIVKQHLPYKRKRSISGWESFNCPACHHNGEPSPDKNNKGGIIFTGNSFTFKCFRCQFRCHWRPGFLLSNKLEKFLKYCMVSDDTISKLKFYCLDLKNHAQEPVLEVTESANFELVSLPRDAVRLGEIADPNNVDYLEVCKYVFDRNLDKFFNEFYWSPEKKAGINHRFIIPFYFENEIVGYTARSVDGTIPKYYSHQQDGFLFNNHLLEGNYNNIVLVEGPLDALSINGVAYLSNELSQKQLLRLKSSGKNIIVLPDKGKSGKFIIETALNEQWAVSFPWENGWENVKDAQEAVQKYGTLWTIYSIMNNLTTNSSKIEILAKKYLK